MIRKSIIAATAVAAMAGAALIPSTASAHHFHGYHGYHGFHGYRYGWFRPGVVIEPLLTDVAVDSCFRARWIKTPSGPRKIIVNVC